MKGGLVRKCIVAHDPQQDLISGSDKYSVLEYFHQSAKCWFCPSTAETRPPPHVVRTFTSIYLRSTAAAITDNCVSPWLSRHPFSVSVQSYGLYVADVRGGEFTQYQATCYVSKHTMVYDEGE